MESAAVVLQLKLKRSDVLEEIRDAVYRQANELAQFRLSMEKLCAETTRAIADLDQRLTALKAESCESLSRTDSRLCSMSSEAQRQGHQLAEVRLWLEKISSETTNAFAHLDSRTATLKVESLNALWDISSRLESASVETSNGLWTLKGELGTRFNDLVNVALPRLGTQPHAAAALLLEQGAQSVDRRRWAVQPQEQYAPAKPIPFDESMDVVRHLYPQVFALWRERLDAVSGAIKATRIGNLANDVDLYSRIFKSFVEIHAYGRVLDVGCGPYGRPYYLQSYPANLISAIEPLPMIAPADFECVRGLNEMLPWPDAAFSTVINATSLDHVVSLEASLDEMSRVLRPGGKLLLWISSIPGSPPYRPTSPDFVPADVYHLFHFDVAWFAPLLADRFETLQCLEFATAAFSHVFYALRPRP